MPPATLYNIATVTNPTSALTDFSLLIDLSRMTAAWWAAVDTSDGTRGRVFSSDGVTEYACDWLDFDDSAETGFLRVKWSGTLAASGTQQLRVYPPVLANTAVAEGDTYGQHNAYDSNLQGYWPDAGPTDRTSTGLDGTASGITAGGATGQVGTATAYSPGATSEIDFGFNNADTDMSDLVSFGVGAWIQDTSTTGFNSGSDRTILSNHAFSNYAFFAMRYRDGTLMFDLLNGTVTVNPVDTVNDSTWHHVWFQKTATQLEIYLDGALIGSTAHASAMPSSLSNRMYMGRVSQGTRYWSGNLDEVSLHFASRSAAWIKQEYDQSSDQATFWGTWSDVLVADPSSRRVIIF